jgi:hypothetical protein
VIATGYDAGTLLDTIEVLDLSSESKTCNNLPNFPKPISSAVGGVHNLLKPVICGGFNAIGSASMDCFTLKDNLWTEVEIIYLLTTTRVKKKSYQFFCQVIGVEVDGMV